MRTFRRESTRSMRKLTDSAQRREKLDALRTQATATESGKAREVEG